MALRSRGEVDWPRDDDGSEPKEVLEDVRGDEDAGKTEGRGRPGGTPALRGPAEPAFFAVVLPFAGTTIALDTCAGSDTGRARLGSGLTSNESRREGRSRGAAANADGGDAVLVEAA